MYDYLFPGFIVLMAALGFVAFTIGRRRAVRVRAEGASMRSQPGQYGWFMTLASVGGATATIFLCWLFLLIVGSVIPFYSLYFIGIAAALLGLGFGLRYVQPEFHARNAIEWVIRFMLAGAAVISILTTLGILLSVIREALNFFSLYSFWDFVTGTTWNPGSSFQITEGSSSSSRAAEFGSLPLFAGTFMIALIAMMVAIPVGLGAAVYMVEFAPRKVRQIAKPVLEVLAGIPTVVYGYFAAITVSPLVVDLAEAFGLDASYTNALSPGLVMGIMIIPFISSLSDDVINSVPQSLRQGALALGTTKGEMIRNVVLPTAMPGIIAASLLAVSRALGETMIVVMAAGMSPNLTANPLENVTTVTVSIVASLTGDLSFDSAYTLSAFALGLVLFAVTLMLNLLSVFMITHFREKYRINTI